MADSGGPILPNITVQQLEYLVAVDRAPTWAHAAEQVGVSPSALSQGLAELERRVGVPLFDRDGRRRVLTPAAGTVVDHAQRVLAQTADLARWAGATRGGFEGVFRVGMIDVAAVDHFAEVLRSFRSERAGLDLRLTVAPSGELLDKLSRGLLELAVCVRPRELPISLVADPLLEEPLRVYGPPGVAPSRRPARWGSWLTFPEGSHTRELVIEALARVGAPTDVVAISHQPDVLCAMVRLGLGWTVLPVVQAERSPDPLTPIRRRPLVTRELVAVRRSAALPDARVDALMDLLRTEARDQQW